MSRILSAVTQINGLAKPASMTANESELTNKAAVFGHWADLSLIDWVDYGFESRIGLLWLIIFALILICAWLGLPRLMRRVIGNSFRTKSVKLTFKWGEWEICPDHETRRVAYQAWVEIQSRKVGLPFEDEHDVIIEVYNSWYQLFGVLRELAKSIPADKLGDCDDTRKLVDLLMTSLNKGLRPHLTCWQAKFRRWYSAEAAKDENAARTPQEIQRTYPEYGDLVSDLKRVNGEFVEFAKSLMKLVDG